MFGSSYVIFVVVDDVSNDWFIASRKPLIIPEYTLPATSFLMTPFEVEKGGFSNIFDWIEMEGKYDGFLNDLLEVY